MNSRRPTSYLWIYAIVAVLTPLAAWAGSHLISSGEAAHQLAIAAFGWGLLAFGFLAWVAILVALPIALQHGAARQEAAENHDALLAKLSDHLQQITILMNLISENQLISDRTKSIVFREKDSETVRRAIVDEIAKQDWDAALALVGEMERFFGYRAEADRFRQDISSKRQDALQNRITEQLAAVDRLTNAEAWGQALQEAHRIMALFPHDEKVTHLPQEIESRRMGRKKKLLDSWHEAVDKHDVDGSIEILKHLDAYLTPTEGEGLQEKVRSVFKEKIGLLRAQFALAVQDHRWQEAIQLGDSIMNEFPNSRMAQEVRDTIVMLRQRAATGNGNAAPAPAV